ncbi:MAG: NFACT family protein, partial [Acidobacteriota bacterium]
MNAGRVSAWADHLDSALAGAIIKQVCRPDPFFLGLALSGGRRTLGFCIRPDRLAVGICEWPWPRGEVPEVLRVHLKGARLTGVQTHPGEPILRLHLASDGPKYLVWEGLGRSANLLLLGPEDEIYWSARVLKGGFRTGTPGEAWRQPPARMEPEAPASQAFDASSDLLEAGPASLRDSLLDSGRRLAFKTLKDRAKRLNRRLDAVARDREEGARWQEQARLGQALLAAKDLHERGLESMECTDYEAEPPAAITGPLDSS